MFTVVNSEAPSSGDDSGAPALRRTRVLTYTFLLAGTAALATATVWQFWRTDSAITTTVTPLLVAIALACVAIGCVCAFVDRARRDNATARMGWFLLAGGVVVALGTTSVVAVTSATVPSGLSGTLAVSGVLTGALIAMAALRFSSPIRGNRVDRGLVLLDTVVGSTGCVLLTYQLVIPSLHGSGASSAALIRPWIDVVVATAVIYLAARSRLPGGLPYRQLRLLIAATTVYVVTDLVTLTMHAHDLALRSAIASIVAQVLVAWCTATAALRPAIETETPTQARHRIRLAGLVPLLPVVGALAVVVWSAGGDTPTSMATAGITSILLTGLLVAILVWRQVMAAGAHNAAKAVATHSFESTTDQPWFQALVGQTSDIVTVTDLVGQVVYQTPSVSRILGFEADHWQDRPFCDLVHLDDHGVLAHAMASAMREPGCPRSVDLSLGCRDGTWRDTETSVTALPGDDGLRGFVLTTRDVSDRRLLSERLERAAETDDLTELPNRAALLRHATESLRGAAPTHIAVLALDLDGFRALNDTLGHGVGDTILRQAAGALRRCVRPWDVVARIGGDEFAVLIVGANAERCVSRVQERLHRALAGVVVENGREIRLAVSAGYAVNDTGLETADELLRNADLVLARARSARRVELLRFEAPMHTALVARVAAEQELRAALSSRQLELVYQPIVRMHDAHIIGAEALVRWRHPERGLITAGEFVPLAEDMGIVHELGVWALRQACRDLANLRARVAGLKDFTVSVNVSGHQVEAGLVDEVQSAASDAGVLACDLVLEVTESVLAGRPDEAAEVLQGLRALGCKVALDDFGTGYSSLAYLGAFPVDIIKIDQSFVADVGSSAQRLALVRTIVALGQALQLTTVAEGVETSEQADLLRGMGCEHAQGYLFSRPIPLRSLEALMESQEATGANPVASVTTQAQRVVVLPKDAPMVESVATAHQVALPRSRRRTS